jgi:hypothetical protein
MLKKWLRNWYSRLFTKKCEHLRCWDFSRFQVEKGFFPQFCLFRNCYSPKEMKLHEKSFLEPKLLESLNLSFRVQTDLNMILDSNNTSKNNTTITIPSSRAKLLSAKRSLVTLKQVANEPKIWKSVQKYIGYKFLLSEVLIRMPEISMKMY